MITFTDQMSADMELDATEIYPQLYQGSVPPHGDRLAKEGFRLVVLCAAEKIPPAAAFKKIALAIAPMHDTNVIHPDHWADAQLAAKHVVDYIRRGKKVLVTCNAGLNRSGVVVALAANLLGYPMQEVIARIQTRRYRHDLHGLCNPAFVSQLYSVARSSK